MEKETKHQRRTNILINLGILISLVLLLILLCGHSAYCQISVTGKIIDAETHEPLPYVSIVVADKEAEGTISNINGEFTLNTLKPEETINFSFVGYKTKTIKVGQTNTTNLTINLQSEEHTLEEIDIVGFTPKSLIEEAYKKIKNNYPKHYPISSGIYRKQITENSKLVFIGDCKMKIKAPTYKEKGKKKFPKYTITNKRISDNTDKDKAGISLEAATTLFIYPDVAYPFVKLKNSIEPRMAKQFKTEDGETVYKIEFENSDEAKTDKGYFYIADKSKAILAIHREQSVNDIETKTQTLKQMYFIFDVFYKKRGSKYTFDYGRANWKINWFGKKEKENRKYEVVIDYLTNEMHATKGEGRYKNAHADPFKKIKDARTVPLKEFKEILPDYK